MFLFNLFKGKSVPQGRSPHQATFFQPADTSGLAVTSELDKALEECKATVERIARECREKNSKFRDIEFDLENDTNACLDGLVPLHIPEGFYPSDVLRVSEIFDDPKFFVDGADSNDIVQGQLGDCWFLSALSTMTTSKGLVEKFCVARDENIGIYGFIFFKDDRWVHVIIDDLLYTNIPKFEELHPTFKNFYHNDKELYNKSARKGNHSLCFAKSSTEGESWVPLIEKAYAKLHGDYASLEGGNSSEAIEDLTGGISSFIQTKDIFDTDKFWTDELMKATDGRLFGCSFRGQGLVKFGLFGNHSYSVLRTREAKGKRWLVIRNPWGNSEWTGPWADGSKEWNAESFDLLPMLEHGFGNDGQFIMEYSDFLECWDEVERTLLLDSDCFNWIKSSHWLRVISRPVPSAWTYGDVCFTVSIPKRSATIIVLSQLDSRYFKHISGSFEWTFDFLLFKRGQTEPHAVSSHPRFYSRSVNLERVLDAGDYVVHVRLDRRPDPTYIDNYDDIDVNQRKLSRVRTAKAQSQSIAANFKQETQALNLGVPIEALAGLSFADMQAKAKEQSEGQEKETEKAALHATTTTQVATISTDGTKTLTENDVVSGEKPTADIPSEVTKDAVRDPVTPVADAGVKPAEPDSAGPPFVPFPSAEGTQGQWEVSEDDTIFLGLRVYTDKAAGAATIGGQLRHEMETGAANLVSKAE
ncbi:hypothetical protein B0H14DRAFT_2757997 [Mycena olivaceomarginata]|nr:hypothetical protein B0H14DRAFT_2757997 [Mycena olivaceomarginata]